MIDTIIFDFDGTIANTSELIINSFKHIYKIYDKNFDETYIRSTFGEPLYDVISRDFRGYDIEAVLAQYRDYQLHRFDDEVFLYDTVNKTLESLYQNEITMGIVTSRVKNSTLKALNKFNINHFFKSVVTADDVQKHKPDKEPLLKCLKNLNRKPSTTLYVGDSRFDLECAINAQVLPVLVGWHHNSNELAIEYKIKHVLTKMYDLIHLL